MALSVLIRSIIPSANRICGASTVIPRIYGEQIYDNNIGGSLVNYVQNRGAARKGKRIERARLARINATKRRLLEAQNPKQKKEHKRGVKVDKNQFRFATERQLDMTSPPPPEDDVFFIDKFRKKRFSFEEIIKFHKQAVHPDILNLPDSLVSATIELNLKMKIKKKKYIETINSTVCYPHIFKYEVRQRKIVALCKEPADQEAAREVGAFTAGSLDVVALLKAGQLTQRDFDHIVCHTDFLADFASVKGMKGQPYFPNKQRSNFGDNIVDLVKYFKDGIDYSLRKDATEPEYGFIDCYFGRLDMSEQQLRENLITLFNSINRFKPLNLADDKQFFERVTITTPATQEMFLLRFWDMIEDYKDPNLADVEGEEEENQRAVKTL